MNILLTGATGFLGRQLVKFLVPSSHLLTAVVRRKVNLPIPQVCIPAGLQGDTDWTPALVSQDVVVHAAARAHILSGEAEDPLTEYRRVNTDGTLNLARQAAACGVSRFIFLSSIGVNGNINTAAFTVSDQEAPAEPYALSKWEAEQGLWQIQRETGMEIVIIRPPLVYGPGAPGNFGSLVRWIEKGVPLPLGAIHNRRSLIGIDNLVDLVVRCIDHPAAANQMFLASDGEDLSTTELLQGVSKAMGRPSRLIPVPAAILQLGATIMGKKAIAHRLLGSLQVDVSKTCELLDWTPPYTVEEGLKRCFKSHY